MFDLDSMVVKAQKMDLDVLKDEVYDRAAKLYHLSSDFARRIGKLDFAEQIMKTLIAVAFSSDGVITKQEYETISQIHDRINIPVEPYESLTKVWNEDKPLFKEIFESGIEMIVRFSMLSSDFRHHVIWLYVYLAVLDGHFSLKEKAMLEQIISESSIIDQEQNDISDRTEVSSDTQMTSEITPEQIIVKEYKGKTITDDDEYYLSVGAELFNPNPEHMAVDVIVKVLIYGANDSIITKETERISFIDPGYIFYFGAEYSVGESKPTAVRVIAEADEFKRVPQHTRYTNKVKFGNYSIQKSRWGSNVLTGTVKNHHHKRFSSVTGYLTFYSKEDDSIIGGVEVKLYDLFANSEDAFEEEVHLDLNLVGKVASGVYFDLDEL